MQIDKSVIIKASNGEVEAFEEIYKMYSGFVYNVALRITHTREDAAEITQDVFMAVYRKLKTFEFKSSFKTWIYRITANLAINHIKRISRHKDNIEYRDDIESSMEAAPDPHSEIIEKEETQHSINSMLNALNPEQRICMILRHVEDLSYEEIATSLKININTVRTRLKRARERLMPLRKEVVRDEVR